MIRPGAQIVSRATVSIADKTTLAAASDWLLEL
jgi:hypothetical protein